MDMDARIFKLMYSYTLISFVDFVKGMYHDERMNMLNMRHMALPEAREGWYDLSPPDSTGPPMYLSSSALGSAGRSGSQGSGQRCRILSRLSLTGAPGEPPSELSPSLLVSVKQVHSMSILIIRKLPSDYPDSPGRVRISEVSAHWEDASFKPDGEQLLAEMDENMFTHELERGLPLLQDMEADGILTNLDEITPGVTVADCMPLFLQTGAWRGLLHSGWAGTGILRRALEFFAHIREQAPGVVMGPCIAVESYEVDEARADLFARRHGANAVRGRHLDLRKANLGILENASRDGLFRLESQIIVRDSCTAQHSGLFSYRRMGPESYGLMLAVFPPHRTSLPVCSGEAYYRLTRSGIRSN